MEENSSSINGSSEMDEERAKVSEDTPVTPLSDTIIGKTWNYFKYNLFSVILLFFCFVFFFPWIIYSGMSTLFLWWAGRHVKIIMELHMWKCYFCPPLSDIQDIQSELRIESSRSDANVSIGEKHWQGVLIEMCTQLPLY